MVRDRTFIWCRQNAVEYDTMSSTIDISRRSIRKGKRGVNFKGLMPCFSGDAMTMVRLTVVAPTPSACAVFVSPKLHFLLSSAGLVDRSRLLGSRTDWPREI